MRKLKLDPNKQYYEINTVLELNELIQIKYDMIIMDLTDNWRTLLLRAFFNKEQKYIEIKKMYENMVLNAKRKEDVFLALSHFWGLQYRHTRRIVKVVLNSHPLSS